MEMDEDKPLLPVTVLSGFLGSGKTTLLKHILHSNTHGLKIAIIVNDMAEVNIDGAHIARLSTKNERDNLVQMQNGCICCTLRGDFLVELATMAWSKRFDYVLIESSGISEPQQVAETFSAALSAEMLQIPEDMDVKDRDVIERIANAGGLETVARIDTMVTVVDAFRFFAEFNTGEFLTDRFGRDEVPPEDERTISDLMADQIEFANVIIINKTDAVTAATLARMRQLISTLNPHAKLLETRFGRVEPGAIVGTRSFDLAEAQLMSGWLASLHAMFLTDVGGRTTLAPVPETVEYGIGSFVYRARRPFEPMRLYRLLAGLFVLIQPDLEEEDEEEDEEEGEGEVSEDDEGSVPGTGSSASVVDVEMADAAQQQQQQHGKRRSKRKDSKGVSSSSASAASSSKEEQEHEAEEAEQLQQQQEDATFFATLPRSPTAIIAAKASHPLWGKMHRSKGWLWLSTRPSQAGSWNTAGGMLRVEYEQEWFCCLEPSAWDADDDADADVRAAVEKDFDGEWGDRRQEIVFIGEALDRAGIERALDKCLLTEHEFARWERLMRRSDVGMERKEELLRRWWDESYWAEWTVGEEEGEGEGGHAGHGHGHAGHNHSRAGHGHGH